MLGGQGTIRRTVVVRLLSAIFAPVLGGCAVLINGSHQRIDFESQPPGATVHVGGETVQTPGSLILPRGDTYQAVFERPGYQPATRTIDRKLSTALVANILTAGLGLIVDFTLGYWLGSPWEPEPARVDVSLQPLAPPPATRTAPP